MAFSKREAAIRVKRSLSFASTELSEAVAYATDTGDKFLMDKLVTLHKQTFQIKDELERKLDSKSG